MNIECRLDKTVDNGSDDMFIGDIVATYTEQKYMTGGAVDIKKTQPFMLSLTTYTMRSENPKQKHGPQAKTTKLKTEERCPKKRMACSSKS